MVDKLKDKLDKAKIRLVDVQKEQEKLSKRWNDLEVERKKLNIALDELEKEDDTGSNGG